MTSTWSEDELQTIEGDHEVVLAARRADGTLTRGVTIWIVRVGAEVFVRSAHGARNRWFARAVAAGAGHITVGGVSRDVVFQDASTGSSHPADTDALDRAYHSKYDAAYPKQYVDPVVDEASHGATLRLLPA
jgi:hypothetical protein